MTWKRKALTLERLLEPRDCRRCGRHMDREFLIARREEQSKRKAVSIKAAQERGVVIGKPRRINWDRIRELRESGHSFGNTAVEMGCSIAQVRYVCKKLGILKISSNPKPILRAFDRSGHRPWLKYQEEK